MIDDELLREYAEVVRSDVIVPPVELVRARASRRQRLHVAAGALAVGVVTAGVVVPIALLHNGSGGARRTQVVITSPSPSPSTKYPLPALGAAGFPASVYPLAHRGAKPGTVASCPNGDGLQTPTSQTRRPSVAIEKLLEAGSFLSDLRSTDRADWPAVQAAWRQHRQWETPTAPRRPNQGHILYTGPLSAPWPRLGVPDPKTWVRESCGARVMRRSYVVASGPTSDPTQDGALQEVQVFVVRDGRPLLYFSYP